ncbi:MAG TPA: glucose-6-phosphate dehydrogenase assembly protein OpcA [Dermatophilaceae bacterium]|nr:glucose-6-phosphate dehydrogenase assembly protein OpcA [Dermatophilaceae bacterium]
MIVDLPSTSTSAISRKLVQVRSDVGAMALSRVLTLVVVINETDADEAIETANDASRQHPCRIIAVIAGNRRGANRLDAQIRVGGDAGASEVVIIRLYGQLAAHGQSVVLPLLLPDSPIVAWWPKEAPPDLSADLIGRMAQRRITDAAEARSAIRELHRRAATYAPGDTDLAWTRTTLWRGLLAAALDQPPYEPVSEATVTGGVDSPSTDLLAAWLANTLRCPVRRARARAGSGLLSVRLERKSGDVDLVRPDGSVATLTQPGQPVRRISLAKRGLAECLADELRRLDPDEIYAETLTRGLTKVGSRGSMTASQAVAEGEAPSLVEARRASRRIARSADRQSSAAMVEHPPVSGKPSTEEVKQAAAEQLAEATATPQKPSRRT